MDAVKREDPVAIAKRVLEIESQAVKALLDRLDGNFTKAVELIFETSGKVVVSGMGKSGIICQKIASTLASTGTPSFFLHPAEGVHGDLGMLMKNDLLIAVSNSGETEEITKIIPVVKRMGIKMISMTGRLNSTLARHADVNLDVGVKEEACPLGLAPTASTTATLAMGDALAVALLERRGFKTEDFANLHPAGSLGRKLMRVEDLMHTGKDVPTVPSGTPVKEALFEITAKRMGLTGVFEGDKLTGVVTDGDLRRALESGKNILDKKVEDVMTRSPKTIMKGVLAEAALKEMEEHSITALFVCDEDSSVVGVLHMHDLLKAGVV